MGTTRQRPTGLVLALATLLCTGACDDAPRDEVAVILDFAGQSRAEVVTYVVGIYEKPSCDFLAGSLAFGFNENTAQAERLHLQTFAEGESTPIGELAEVELAFVGLGLDEDCQQIFVGCEMVTIGQTAEVVISMEEVESPDDYCDIVHMRTCENGACRPSNW